MEEIGSTDKRIATAVSVILLLVVAAVAVFYVREHAADLWRAFDFSSSKLLGLFLLSVGFTGLNGLRIKILLGVFGGRLGVAEATGLAALTSLLNYLPGQGGMVGRAIYLRQVHELPLPKFASILAGSYVVTFWALGGVGLAAIPTVFITTGHFPLQIAAVLTGIVALGLLLMQTARFGRLSYEGALRGRIAEAWNGWLTVARDRKAVRKLAAVDCLTVLVYSVRLIIVFSLVSEDLSAPMALTIAPLSMLSVLASVTPGALGIKEGVVGLAGTQYGVTLPRGVQAAVVDRAVMFIVVVLISGIFSLFVPGLYRYAKRYKSEDRESD